ncbi:MAG: hypothetical protein GY757_39275 [bacterium]|nr:hypothetical protein [bacterium]
MFKLVKYENQMGLLEKIVVNNSKSGGPHRATREEKMKKLIVMLICIGLICGGLLMAQTKDKAKKDKPKKEVKVELTKCQKMVKNNDATNAIIISVGKQIAELEKKMGGFPPQAAKDMKDFTEWYGKANKLYEVVKKKVAKGECNKAIIKDLGWVWQYYVKAATMAVNAKSRAELELKNRKRRKKK